MEHPEQFPLSKASCDLSTLAPLCSMFPISCCSLTASCKPHRKMCAQLLIHYKVLSMFVFNITNILAQDNYIKWKNKQYLEKSFMLYWNKNTSLLTCWSNIGTILETFKKPAPCSWQYNTTPPPLHITHMLCLWQFTL